ncbi:MAG: amylo-alpha-1,6-glucosidase [Suipraeoptans sp.]
MSTWIWKFGEFEVYHNMLVHNRRQSYGYVEAPVWKIYSPDTVVQFSKEINTKGGVINIYACGEFTVELETESGELIKYRGLNKISLPSGKYTLLIRVTNPNTFPCLFVDGEVETDETWMADDVTPDRAPVGTYHEFNCKDKSPDIFPFEYKKIAFKSKKNVEGGILFDFGKEVFAKTKFKFTREKGTVFVGFGETREESMDENMSVIHFNQIINDEKVDYPAYAFRYVYVKNDNVELEAEYEYLPLEYIGNFKSDDAVINKIWDVAAYTFHLNCREFFLDGIKRDRWVWSGDVYQSLFVNHYLFMDKNIEKRSLIALGGKLPFKQHINTIMDYTFFWIISCYEYYITYGDKEFVRQIHPQLCEVIEFCINRTDNDGLIREKTGDWIFIDWCDMDKTGAVCGEQILFAKALSCYAELCKVLEYSSEKYDILSKSLISTIKERFYDKSVGAFIDSYESKEKNITRQNNLLAYHFLPCSDETKQSIYDNVILNNDISRITTPYFKFYENLAHCESGNDDIIETLMKEYYGAMLDIGATTFYEEFDPSKNGVEHYSMYGNPYEKSLCHAWSASPIFLLGRYRLGVKNTGIAYNTFEVEPKLGGAGSISGRVPLPGGYVDVSMSSNEISVLSTQKGGELLINNNRIVLKQGQKTTVKY